MLRDAYPTIPQDFRLLVSTLKADERFETFQEAPGRSKLRKMCLKWLMLNECDSGCRKKKAHHVLTDLQKKKVKTFLKRSARINEEPDRGVRVSCQDLTQ